MPTSPENLEKFKTVLESDHLRRALRFQQWINIALGIAMLASNVAIVWLLTSHNAKQLSGAINALARVAKATAQ